MLGNALMREFSADRPIGWGMMDMDITDEKRLTEKIQQLRPNVILNAAAYTDVDRCETAESLASRVNGTAVGYLAKAAKTVGAVLVHFSTDYVFDGQKKDGYAESDQTGPINAYGRGKLLGEQMLVQFSKKYYLIRTSWLFGPGGKNFVETILTNMRNKNTLTVVDDQFGKPTYTPDLALQTRFLLENKKEFGIYHITNETPKNKVSWFEFAQDIADIAGLDSKIESTTSDDYKRPAKRPRFSILQNTKLPKLRDYRLALKDYVRK